MNGKTGEDNVMNFYEALRTAIVSTPNKDKLIILGYFNAHFGRAFEIWNVLGRYSNGKVNALGLKILDLYSRLSLTICNIL